MRTTGILVSILFAQTAMAAIPLALPEAPAGKTTAHDDPAPTVVAMRAAVAGVLPAQVPVPTTPVVITDIVGTPATTDPNDSTNIPALQINGTDPVKTGYLEFKYGADGKGAYNVFVKSRGTAMNDFATVQPGDRIITNGIQAGTGWQAGHLGTETWVVDGANITPNEVNGRWALATDTGILSTTAAKSPYPNRYGLLGAIIANSFQQVYFPGGIGTPNRMPAVGSNFGGWVVIGAGGPSPGFAPLKFQTGGAVLLTTPESGVFEVDAGAIPYFTGADSVRRSFALEDTGMPTIAVAAGAGNNAAATVDASGSAGTITLVTGSSPSAGPVATLTYAHPYGAASYPVFSFGNANGPASASQMYVTGTRSGFVLSNVTALAPNTTYIITYAAPGR